MRSDELCMSGTLNTNTQIYRIPRRVPGPLKAREQGGDAERSPRRLTSGTEDTACTSSVGRVGLAGWRSLWSPQLVSVSAGDDAVH